jgi:Flp pilus assembly pilin Flp
MTEYIIITALIAIAAIVVFAAFGDTVKNQTAAMAKELSGQDGSAASDKARERADAGESAAAVKGTLKEFAGKQTQ